VASELAAYFVSIVPSAKGLTGKIAKEFAGVDREAAKSGKTSGSAFSNAFKGALTGVAAAFSVGAITDFVSSAVDGAGKAEQSMGALDSVFKGSSGQMKDWAKDAAKNVGLTGNEFSELSVLIGSQLKNGGTAMDKLAPKTNDLIGMGADLSSMFGGSAKDAVDALSSALKGERDPIEKYGVSLNQSKIDAEAAALGFEKVGGALSAEATQAATLSLITKQTADAHGNFAKESDTFAHKQEVMSAKWEDLKVKIGEQFMPALSGAFGFITDTVIPALGNFRDGLANVGQWVKDNAAWLIPLTAAVAGYAIAMGTLSIVSTVRGWLAAAAAAQWGLNLAMTANPIGLIVAGIVALVAGLVWFFTQTELGKQIVANVWGFIQTVVGGVVDWFTNTALPIIQDVFNNVGAVFTWLYENIIRPVFESISTVIGGVIAFVTGVFNLIIAVIQKVLAPAFQWLYNNVIKPVFDNIAAALQWVWDNTIKRIFDAWVWIFKNVLGPAFDWLWKTIIKPAFDGIGAAIKWVWDNVLKPVFDTLSKFIKETIPKAFDAGVAAIKTAWDKIQEIAKAPVKFVVNTIINDGLIAGFNSLAVPLGVKALDKVALPAGFADGGYTGPGGKYQPAGIVHAGEVVWSQDDISRWGGVGVVEAMRKAAGFARGGIVNPLKAMALTQGYNRVHKGIDLAAQVGTPVFATQAGRVSHAGPGAQAPGVWGGNEVHIAGGGIETWFAHLSSIGVKLGDMVRAGQQIGLSGNTGITSGPHLHFGTFNGGWPNDIDPLAYLGGAGIPSGGGFNPIAGIIDGLMSKIKESGSGPFADMAIGIGKKLIDSASKFVTDFLSGNRDKKGSATATVFDGGGWLENTGGSQLVQHNKRKPDAVLSHDQWATMSRIADNSRGAGVTFTGPIHVRDEHELASIISTRQRDAQAAYGF
jgi:murein DD-endopeptidase MepM/ murein hydrolase activator NlpD